jgi:phenylpropionate dioxygenase-like ring-hydroxylating dioxygenase large terminal subunit
MEDVRSGTEQQNLGTWPRYNAAVLGFRNYWYPVMLSRGLRRRPKPITICGDRIALFRENGKVYALSNRCPHRGIPLSEARREFPGTISCVYHGWTYDLKTGELVGVLTDGPDSPICGKVNVRTYPVEERAGVIWVYVGELEPPPLEDDIPEEFLRKNATVEGYAEVRKGNWREAMENCIDEGHSKYLHRTALTSFWRDMPAWTTGVEMIPSEDGRWIRRVRGDTVVSSDYPGLGQWPKRRPWAKQLTGQSTQLANRLPCYCRVGNPRTDKEYVSYQIFVPVDATHYLAMMLSVSWVRGKEKVKFHLNQLWSMRWGKMHGFDPQDKRMIGLMDIPPERLYRPDRSITGWRKWCQETARPQRTDEQPGIDRNLAPRAAQPSPEEPAAALVDG